MSKRYVCSSGTDVPMVLCSMPIGTGVHCWNMVTDAPVVSIATGRAFQEGGGQEGGRTGWEEGGRGRRAKKVEGCTAISKYPSGPGNLTRISSVLCQLIANSDLRRPIGDACMLHGNMGSWKRWCISKQRRWNG